MNPDKAIHGQEKKTGTVETCSAASYSEHQEDLEKVATGSGINFLGSIARNISLFLYAALLANFLEPASVGLFFLGLTVMTILGTAALLGLDMGIVRFAALYNGEGDRARVRGTIAGAVVVAVPASIAIGALLYLFSDPVSVHLFRKPDLGPVLRSFAPAVPLFVLASLLCAGTQGLHRMQYQVLSRDVAEQTGKFVFSALALFLGFGLTGVVWSNVAGLMLAAMLAFVFLLRLEPLFGHGAPKTFEQKKLLKYSSPLAFSALLGLLLLWTDTLILGYFRSAEEVGIYGVATRIAVVGLVILASFRTMFAPQASDFFYRGEKERLEQLLKTVTKWIVGLSLPVYALLAIYSNQVLRIMGEQYLDGENALKILVLGQFINAAVGPVALTLMMCGRPRIVLITSLAGFGFDLSMCFLLIPPYGVEGAALASAAAMTVFNLSTLAAVIFLVRLQPFSMGYMKVILIGLLAVVATLMIKYLLPDPWNLALSFIFFVSCYSFLYYRNVFEESDLMLLRMLKGKIFGKKKVQPHCTS